MRPQSSLRCALFALGLAAPSLCAAQTAVECAESFERGQVERAALRYGAAKQEFVVCSRLACPQFIVKDCVEALETVEREIPSFGFRVRDEDGHELFRVRVTIDGTLLTEALDGSMYQRDPGVYRVRFEARDFRPLDTTLSLHPGERTRVVDVKLESNIPRAPAVTAEAVARAPLPTPALLPPPPPFRVPLASVVAAGTAAVALGGFTFFRLRASSDYDALEECRPYCSKDRVDAVRTKYVLSSVALGISGAALATAGVTLWLLQPRVERPGVALELRPSGGAVRAAF